MRKWFHSLELPGEKPECSSSSIGTRVFGDPGIWSGSCFVPRIELALFLHSLVVDIDCLNKPRAEMLVWSLWEYWGLLLSHHTERAWSLVPVTCCRSSSPMLPLTSKRTVPFGTEVLSSGKPVLLLSLAPGSVAFLEPRYSVLS